MRLTVPGIFELGQRVTIAEGTVERGQVLAEPEVFEAGGAECLITDDAKALRQGEIDLASGGKGLPPMVMTLGPSSTSFRTKAKSSKAESPITVTSLPRRIEVSSWQCSKALFPMCGQAVGQGHAGQLDTSRKADAPIP